MRRIQIKIWPELKDYIPAIIPFDRINNSKVNPIDIDFTNVYSIESAGLNLILIKLLKSFSAINKRDWDIKFSNDETINNKIFESGFINILMKNIPNHKLFLQTQYLESVVGQKAKKSEDLISFPIYELDFSLTPLDRRETVENFKDYLVDKLEYLFFKYKLKVNKFIQILHEIAKNSADHTNEKAFFGLDICESEDILAIQFSFGDLGEGINQNVRRAIEQKDQFQFKHKHLAVTDSYHYALSSGFTSKPWSMLNRGIGMSTIFDLSKQINLTLSVFDAESRGLLSSAKNNSHVELRKIFYAVGFNVGFYYYGELIHKIKK